MSTTLEVIRAAVAHNTDTDPDLVVPEAKLVDLGVDSLMLIELTFYVEDAIGKTVNPPTPLPTTVAELIAVIEAS